MGHENAKKTSVKVIELINQHNENLPAFTEMEEDIQEILKWKTEVKKEKVEKHIKTETIEEDIENVNTLKTEADPDLNIEDETDIEIDVENEITTKTISVKSENLHFEWYKFSARFITEEFKLQYVHPDAEATNKKKVFDWYEKCCDMGLVPDEFNINAEV